MKNQKNIAGMLHRPVYEFEKFHLKTKVKKPVRNVNSKYWPEEWIKVYYKGYSRFEEIKLPAPKLASKITLKSALLKRVSTRRFSKVKVKLEELSSLLYYSAGMSPNKSQFAARRFYPSGGGRFPLEVYIISLNTELDNGIYHYYVKNNSLEKMFDFKKGDFKNIVNLKWASEAGFIILITALFKRNTVKYGDRGYRHVLSEAGHLGQNFYLLANALDLGICGVGGYLDDKVNEALEIDGLNETVIYFLALGKKHK